jgi:hypothetical protein
VTLGEVTSAHRGRPWWLLLLPASFLFHITEEWFAGQGFPAWTAQLGVSGIPPTRFIIINAIAWPLSAVLMALGIIAPEFDWFPVAFATMISVNGVLHAVGTVVTATYSPGLITGLLLFLPLGLAALRYCRRSVTPDRFAMAVVAGLLIHLGVIVIAFS